MGWASKSPGATVRIVAVLHAMNCVADNKKPWNIDVPAETMDLALKIIEVAKSHAITAFKLMGNDQTTAMTYKAWDWISTENERNIFSAKNLFDVKQGTFKTMEPCNAVLSELCQRGYIRKLPEEKKTTSGRKSSPLYEVRPDA